MRFFLSFSQFYSIPSKLLMPHRKFFFFSLNAKRPFSRSIIENKLLFLNEFIFGKHQNGVTALWLEKHGSNVSLFLVNLKVWKGLNEIDFGMCQSTYLLCTLFQICIFNSFNVLKLLIHHVVIFARTLYIYFRLSVGADKKLIVNLYSRRTNSEIRLK